MDKIISEQVRWEEQFVEKMEKKFKVWRIAVACEAQFKHRSASNGG